MPVNLTCPTCETPFSVPPSQAKRRRWCSKQCQSTGVERGNRAPLTIEGDIARVPLYAQDKSIRAYALIDAADAERVSQYRWHIGSGGYPAYSLPRPNQNPVEIKLHRFLMGLEPGDPMEVDHIGRNRLDARRAKLRFSTKAQQPQNRGSHRGSSSQYRGVSYFKPSGKWWAYVRVGGKLISLGHYTDEDEAGRVAREARLRLMPFAVD